MTSEQASSQGSMSDGRRGSQPASVAVIGAGVSGLTAAIKLEEAKRRVNGLLRNGKLH